MRVFDKTGSFSTKQDRITALVFRNIARPVFRSPELIDRGPHRDG